MTKKSKAIPVISQQRLRKLVREVSIPWRNSEVQSLDNQVEASEAKLLKNRAHVALKRKLEAARERQRKISKAMEQEKRSLLALIDLALITPD